MRYLDSNVIIRLITNDVPELTQQALKMVEESEANGLTIVDAVITEVCFVLEFNQNYRLPRRVIYDGLYAIFDTAGANRGEYTDTALDLYVKYPDLDYVDCLLYAMANGEQAGVVTFDKQLLRVLDG